MHSFLTTYLGGTLFPLLDVSERNFFSGGGGGARAPSALPPPPAYAPACNVVTCVLCFLIKT